MPFKLLRVGKNQKIHKRLSRYWTSFYGRTLQDRDAFSYVNNPKNFVDTGGGVLGCRGFHSSFRATQSGLSLNMDVSTTMIVTPGPAVDFLLANRNARNPDSLDWNKAKRTLKNLRIKVSPSNQEYKITGRSDQFCEDQLFTLRQKMVKRHR